MKKTYVTIMPNHIGAFYYAKTWCGNWQIFSAHGFKKDYVVNL